MSARRVLGVVLALAALAGVVAGGVAWVERSREVDVVAVFDDATGVTLGYQVRTGGVQVGRVSSVRVERGRAVLGLAVEPGLLPLRRDASATIRPANLLGESYVELDVGAPNEPPLGGAFLGPERTSSSVTLQEVLDAADAPTSTALAAVVTGLGEGVEGAGPQASDALAALAPAAQRADELAAILERQNTVIGELVERTRPVTAALADGGGERLDRLVGTTRATLDTVAQNRRALDAILTELPSTVGQARGTLRQLAATADATTPVLRSVRPVTGDLTEVASELQGLTDVADPALAALPPVLDRARGLLDEAAPVVADLRRAAPDLARTTGGLRPLGEELLDDEEHLTDLMEFVRKWSLSTNGSDGLSHYFRGVVHATPAAFQQFVAGSPFGPPLGEAAPFTAQPLPDLPGTDPLGDPDAGPNGPAPGPVPAPVPAPGPGSPGNVTGLDPSQERSMVGQLLGGR